MDLAAYSPYTCGLALGASLSEKPYAEGSVCDLGSMLVLNQRYPNKNWITMTGKVGRKLCWYGCATALPLSGMSRIGYLNVGYGIEDGPMSWHCVPVAFDKGLLSNGRPCIAFSVRLTLADPGRPGFDIVWRGRGAGAVRPRGRPGLKARTGGGTRHISTIIHLSARNRLEAVPPGEDGGSSFHPRKLPLGHDGDGSERRKRYDRAGRVRIYTLRETV